MNAADSPVQTAAGRGLLACHHCGTVWRGAQVHEPCARCGTRLHRRKPDSLNRTWALVIAAAILYLPANLLPVMITRTIFDMVEEHIEQAAELKSSLPADFAVLKARYEDARRAFTASGLDITACFNDPMPGNFLLSPDNQVK